MLNKKVEKALQAQIQKEGFSSNLYLSMASWAETKGMAGIAAWFYAQAEEENEHMLKIIRFVNERGGHAIVPAFEQPQKEFDSVRGVFELSLEHERKVTASINEIVGICLEEKDYSTFNWIQWFVSEQIEEEASVTAILDKLNLIGDGPLYVFDNFIMSMRGGH